MRRALLPLAITGLCLSLVPARAGISTSTSVARVVNLDFQIFDPMTGLDRMGGASIRSVAGASSSGGTITPTADFVASAYDRACDDSGCIEYEFPDQVVQPTALNMDPLGNVVQFRACLFPMSGSCRSFDLTFTRPASLSPIYCFPLLACLNVNAWFDPATNSALLSAFESIGVHRFGYSVTGTFNGGPLPTTENMSSESAQTLGLSQTVTAP
jgi:hypothetical protein